MDVLDFVGDRSVYSVRNAEKITMKINVLTTENESWGFFGTIANHANPEAAWDEAFTQIAAATGCSAVGVRHFLDSRHGRHFADEVSNGLASGAAIGKATAAAIALWRSWKIGRRVQQEEGIPVGLPYLTGRVAHFEVEAEAA